MELMDAGGDYRATAAPAKPPPEQPPETVLQEPKEKKDLEKPVEVEKPVAAEKTVEVEKPREEENEYPTESLLTAGDGKIRVVLNYPLAAMFCFMAVVIVICAVLVGWKLGRDRAEQRYRELLDERPKPSKTELAESADERINE